MVKESEKIFNFMDLDFQDITRNFIYNATHPKTNEELPHNVHIRDPQTVISKWKTKLKMDEITKIQNSCKGFQRSCKSNFPFTEFGLSLPNGS